MPLPMQTSPAPQGYRPARCPECAALVRGDVPWCTACYVRLDGAPPAEPATAPGAVSGAPRRTEPLHADPRDVEAVDVEAVDVAAVDVEAVDVEAVDVEAVDVEAVAARLLAELAATREHPGWAGWVPGTRAGRAAAVAALLAGCSAVLLAAMALVGLAL
jgi:hypothetical protein